MSNFLNLGFKGYKKEGATRVSLSLIKNYDINLFSHSLLDNAKTSSSLEIYMYMDMYYT